MGGLFHHHTQQNKKIQLHIDPRRNALLDEKIFMK